MEPAHKPGIWGRFSDFIFGPASYDGGAGCWQCVVRADV